LQVATSLRLKRSSHGHGCCWSCRHRLPRACIEAADPRLLLWQLRRIVILHHADFAARPHRAPLRRRHLCRVVPESRGLLPAARGLHVGLLRDGLPLRDLGPGPRRGEGGGARPRRWGARRGRDAAGVGRRGRKLLRRRRRPGGLLPAKVCDARRRRGRQGGRAGRPDSGACIRGGGARVAAGGPARRGRVGQLLRAVVDGEPLPARRRVRRLTTRASAGRQLAQLAGQQSLSRSSAVDELIEVTCGH
jgi:hypothetical protein